MTLMSADLPLGNQAAQATRYAFVEHQVLLPMGPAPVTLTRGGRWTRYESPCPPARRRERETDCRAPTR
jgi:hypothetical protein